VHVDGHASIPPTKNRYSRAPTAGSQYPKASPDPRTIHGADSYQVKWLSEVMDYDLQGQGWQPVEMGVDYAVQTSAVQVVFVVLVRENRTESHKQYDIFTAGFY
jgi:hypothetical protein